MEFSLQFEHRYDVGLWQVEAGLQTRKFFFPGGSQVGGKDGVLLLITPISGAPWVGSFAPGNPSGAFLSRTMSCPDADQLCVVSSGAGYLVRADEPSNWKSVRAIPVCDACAILDKHLLILSDFTKLVAYGSGGVMWESQRVSSDGIEITDIAEGRMTLIGWDAADQKKVRVSLSLDDGSIVTRSIIC